MKLKCLFLPCVVVSFVNNLSFAQDRPIGYWRSHLPYNNTHSIATDGNTVFAATDLSFFSYNMVSGEISTYSKTDGMSDLGMSRLGYDKLTGTVILGYTNSNIDLFKDNSFYNIPYLKIKPTTSTKTINDIYTENGLAYLSTGIGVVVVNLTKKEVKETYGFTQDLVNLSTNAFTSTANNFFTATPKGLFRANRNAVNLQAISSWQLIGPGKELDYLAQVQEKVFASGTDSLFVLENDSLRFLSKFNKRIRHIDAGNNALWICLNDNGISYKMSLNYNIVDSAVTGYPLQVIDFAAGALAIADAAGLQIKVNGNIRAVVPAGPRSPGTFDIYAENKEVAIAHGSFDDIYHPKGNSAGISIMKNDHWVNYGQYTFYPFYDSVADFVAINKNPVDGSIWAGSLWKGLFILHTDGSYEMIQGNILENKPNESYTRPANSITPDNDGNMWLTQFACPDELLAHTKDGKWLHFSTNFPRSISHAAGGITIDDANQKWFYSTVGPSMIIVYNDNGTLDNAADDRSASFTAADGLPGSVVWCMTKDNNGALWIGTDDGIARFNCPENALDGNCKPEIPVVKYDQFAGRLFQTEKVNTIAVDGANRKWIGTNNGVWLVSPDADKIIYRFTSDNSPLPSNIVRKIAIDKITGDVYIGTDNGLVSYRSTATDGNKTNKNIVTFPNPVPSGYSGTIAIRGLTDDADVRITDIDGQLIYRTKSLGGQAVWSGKDYTGRRPQSGVYLIFITNKDGSQTNVGKMVFME